MNILLPISHPASFRTPDFQTEEPYLIVSLDEASPGQQVSEGWFTHVSQAPRKAISMSVRQIQKAKEIIAVVPDARKASAVKTCFEGEISPVAPGSILRAHPNTTVFLDKHSRCFVRPETRDKLTQ